MNGSKSKQVHTLTLGQGDCLSMILRNKLLRSHGLISKVKCTAHRLKASVDSGAMWPLSGEIHEKCGLISGLINWDIHPFRYRNPAPQQYQCRERHFWNRWEDRQVWLIFYAVLFYSLFIQCLYEPMLFAYDGKTSGTGVLRSSNFGLTSHTWMHLKKKCFQWELLSCLRGLFSSWRNAKRGGGVWSCEREQEVSADL